VDAARHPDMNKPAALSLLAALLVCTPACEQQSYDETKMFNQSNKVGKHGHGSAAEHGVKDGAQKAH
jgi:hypothetical protein